MALASAACTPDKEPSTPIALRAEAAPAAKPSDDYARFEADIVTTLVPDTTSVDLAGGMTVKDPARLEAIREAARRPLIAAYHFAYLDSAGNTSVVLSAPSEVVPHLKGQRAFPDWDKVAELRMSAGSALPEVIMRDGTVLAAEVPANIAGLRATGLSTSHSRTSARAAIRGAQLRAFLGQLVRSVPESPEGRRDAERSDSVRRSAGHSRRWERISGDVEVVTHQEIKRPARAGQAIDRIVVEVRHPRVVGSAKRLTGEE